MDTLEEWQDWSNELALLLPEDAEVWPGCNPEGAQESITLDALLYLVGVWEAQPCRWPDGEDDVCAAHLRQCPPPTGSGVSVGLGLSGDPVAVHGGVGERTTAAHPRTPTAHGSAFSSLRPSTKAATTRPRPQAN